MFGFTYKDAAYYYVKNLQGDIIGILNQAGEQITRYDYNAWGSPDMYDGQDFGEVGEANPLRYRSYYFDTETYMYYLNSRYYHPEYHRFISADSVLGANGDVLSYNLFTYCSNNPVMFSDPSGMKMEPTNNWLEAFLLALCEIEKMAFIYKLTERYDKNQSMYVGDMRVFDYPNGYNTVVDEIFDGTLGIIGDIVSVLLTLLLGVAGGLEAIWGILSTQVPAMLFSTFQTDLNKVLTDSQKIDLFILDGINVGVPLVVAVLGALNIWNPAGYAALGISIGTFFGTSFVKNVYLKSIKNQWHSVV